MTGHPFRDAGGTSSAADGALQGGRADVRAPHEARIRRGYQARRREQVLPAELGAQGGGGPYARRCNVGRAEPGLHVAQVEHPDTLDMLLQRLAQRLGQDGSPVARPFAIAHHDLLLLEVQIANPQVQALRQAQPAAIQQSRHQTDGALELTEHGANFVPGQHGGKDRGHLGRLHLVEPRQLPPQHMLVQKQQSAARLVLRGGAHPGLHRQGGEKGLHILGPELAWVAFAVVQNESPDPVYVRLLRAHAVVETDQHLPHAREQPRRPRPTGRRRDVDDIAGRRLLRGEHARAKESDHRAVPASATTVYASSHRVKVKTLEFPQTAGL